MTCGLCGYEPTELDTPTCKNRAHCQACLAVAKVDEEINQAVVALRRLLVKRCDLRSEQNHVHGLIHRLPLELKNYIFELLLSCSDEWSEIAMQNTRKVIMPLHLTSICRSWRNIVRSNPSLWSTIHLGIGGKVSTSDLHSRINFLHEWILRSRTMPLTLHIVVRPVNGSEEELKVVLDAISPSSNKWHSLSLELPLEMLSAFQHSSVQCRLLKRLRIDARKGWRGDINPPVPFLNSEVSPEEIELRGISFQSLQISWNHLSTAMVEWFTLEDIVQLFQHASQMTDCHISAPRPPRTFSMPPIFHQRLKTLRLYSGRSMGTQLLGSLTLPCLQEFHVNDVYLLPSAPLLVQRSSCPLTTLNLSLNYRDSSNLETLYALQPLPGVTDLVLESVLGQGVAIEKLLLSGYLPDLHRLTLRLHPFCYLWGFGTISRLLARKQLRSGTEAGRRCKVLVIHRRVDDLNALVWRSEIGRTLKLLRSFSLREDGFEFSIPSLPRTSSMLA